MNRTSVIAVTAMIFASIAMTASFFIIFDRGEEHGYELDHIMDSVLEISCYKDGSKVAMGTGFVAGADGYILTNAHLVVVKTSDTTEYYDEIKARNANSLMEYVLSVARYDYEKDLALLRITTENDLKPLSIDGDRPRYGERITIIGNALGYGLSVKEGLVSIPEIDVVNEGTTLKCVMVSLSIDHGDSGAPIINDNGEIIGISSFVLKTKDGGSNAITACENACGRMVVLTTSDDSWDEVLVRYRGRNDVESDFRTLKGSGLYGKYQLPTYSTNSAS